MRSWVSRHNGSGKVSPRPCRICWIPGDRAGVGRRAPITDPSLPPSPKQPRCEATSHPLRRGGLLCDKVWFEGIFLTGGGGYRGARSSAENNELNARVKTSPSMDKGPGDQRQVKIQHMGDGDCIPVDPSGPRRSIHSLGQAARDAKDLPGENSRGGWRTYRIELRTREWVGPKSGYGGNTLEAVGVEKA